MKRNGMLLIAGFAMVISANLIAATAPIQRIDVANLLWNSASGEGGSTQTSVVVTFINGGLQPCFTTTLPFQGAITVWVGAGWPCLTAVSSVTVTPIPTVLGMVYEAPMDSDTSGGYYSTQIIISQQTAPQFDDSNGALLMSGTAQTTILNHLADP